MYREFWRAEFTGQPRPHNRNILIGHDGIVRILRSHNPHNDRIGTIGPRSDRVSGTQDEVIQNAVRLIGNRQDGHDLDVAGQNQYLMISVEADPGILLVPFSTS